MTRPRYRLIKSQTDEGLTLEVSIALQDGYTLHGPPIVIPVGFFRTQAYYQAVILQERERTS